MQNKIGRCVSAAKQYPHRPGTAPAFGLRAGSDDTLYLNKSVTRPRGQRQGLEGVDDDERFDTVTR